MIVQVLCLTFALAINKSASQTMTATPTTCISAETQVTLRCNTTDFASTILFYLNGINKGGCFSGTCNTGIAGYVKPTQSGEFTDMIISSYDHSRDGGSWTCSYGSSTSSPYTVELENCKSPDSPERNPAPIIGGVLGGILGLTLIALSILMLYKKYKRKGHQSESQDKNDIIEPLEQTTPVEKGTQLVQPGPEGQPQIDYHKGQPLEPEGPLRIKTRENYVEFQWKPPKSDGSQITEYIVEVHGINFDTWDRFASSPKIKLQVPIDKFKDGEVMSFRVRAKNENGLSKPLLAQEPFKLQNSHDLLSDRPVVTNQGRGPAGFLPRNSVGTEHKQGSLLNEVPSDRKLPEPVK